MLSMSCGSSRREPAPFPLVDPRVQQAAAGQRGWEYERSVSADLDGDGDRERVVVIANVTLRSGQPLWDDGNLWHVYVEEPDGRRTYLFSRLVQLGRLEVRLAEPRGTEPPAILLLELSPHTIALYEIRYRGPGDVRIVESLQRSLHTLQPM